MLFIGIDTGKHTGMAVWDSFAACFLLIDTMKIHQAMKLVEDYASKAADGVTVIFEDARQRKWFGNTGKEVAQGAGSVKRDAVIWEDFLTDLGIPFRAMPPAKGVTKMTATTFRALTGWQRRTSEHARDAAMLVFGR